MDEPQRPRPRNGPGGLPVGRDPAAVRQRIEALEQMLERAFTVPGINRPIGLDAIVGLVPLVGDVITAAMGAYIIWEANNLGLPKWKLWRMGGNLLFDSAVGCLGGAILFRWFWTVLVRGIRETILARQAAAAPAVVAKHK